MSGSLGPGGPRTCPSAPGLMAGARSLRSHCLPQPVLFAGQPCAQAHLPAQAAGTRRSTTDIWAPCGIALDVQTTFQDPHPRPHPQPGPWARPRHLTPPAPQPRGRRYRSPSPMGSGTCPDKAAQGGGMSWLILSGLPRPHLPPQQNHPHSLLPRGPGPASCGLASYLPRNGSCPVVPLIGMFSPKLNMSFQTEDFSGCRCVSEATALGGGQGDCGDTPGACSLDTHRHDGSPRSEGGSSQMWG